MAAYSCNRYVDCRGVFVQYKVFEICKDRHKELMIMNNDDDVGTSTDSDAHSDDDPYNYISDSDII